MTLLTPSAARLAAPRAPRAVVMARAPHPGAVKTRLVGGSITPVVASQLALAMLQCVVERVGRVFSEVVLAISPDEDAIKPELFTTVPAAKVVAQGGGDLGQRIIRAWQEQGVHSPVAVFGMDSPDIPHAELQRLHQHLAAAGPDEVWIGPTPDGGYWTIAGLSCPLPAFGEIDWGTSLVYDQTLKALRNAGLKPRPLIRWHDVDTPDDLASLRNRLIAGYATAHLRSDDDPALLRLRTRINTIL